jgi:hyperosmotically inducible periplasmic protein
MKKLRNLMALSFAVVAFSFVGASAQDSSALANSIDLGKQVQKSILKLPYYEVFDHIDFTVEGSTVSLNGKVRNANNKSAAENVVKRIKGVTAVVNNIEVLPIGSFDEKIRRDLYASISRMGGLSRYLWTVNPDVRLIVERGHVTLEGSVYSESDKNMMRITAMTVPGAFSVTNNLTVGSSGAR